MPSPYDLQARISALSPQSREGRINEAFDRRRRFLEGTLAERGIFDSGVADQSILELEQDRLNELNPLPRSGGRTSQPPPESLELPGPQKPPPSPRFQFPQFSPPPQAGGAPGRDGGLETPDFIGQLTRAIGAANELESQRAGTQPGPEVFAQERMAGEMHAQMNAVRAGFSPRSLQGLGPMSPGTPSQAFRDELRRQREDPRQKTPLELARSVVSSWHQAEVFQRSLDQLNNNPRLEQLMDQARRLQSLPSSLDEFGQVVPPSQGQVAARETQLRRLAASIETVRRVQDAERQKLMAARDLQVKRVQTEYKLFESRLEDVQKMRAPDDKKSMSSYLRRIAREIAVYSGIQDRGSMKAYQVVMTTYDDTKKLMKAHEAVMAGLEPSPGEEPPNA